MHAEHLHRAHLHSAKVTVDLVSNLLNSFEPERVCLVLSDHSLDLKLVIVNRGSVASQVILQLLLEVDVLSLRLGEGLVEVVSITSTPLQCLDLLRRLAERLAKLFHLHVDLSSIVRLRLGLDEHRLQDRGDQLLDSRDGNVHHHAIINAIIICLLEELFT